MWQQGTRKLLFHLHQSSISHALLSALIQRLSSRSKTSTRASSPDTSQHPLRRTGIQTRMQPCADGRREWQHSQHAPPSIICSHHACTGGTGTISLYHVQHRLQPCQHSRRGVVLLPARSHLCLHQHAFSVSHWPPHCNKDPAGLKDWTPPAKTL
jgi:hypothetical protein